MTVPAPVSPADPRRRHVTRAMANLVLAGLLAGACATQRPPVGGQYVFSTNGVEYTIVSFRETSGAGGNYLIRRDANHIVMRATDLDQDGVIEAVLVGDLSVDEANRLYTIGLDLARLGGKLDDRQAPRIFTVSERDRVLTLRSVVAGPGAPFNTLTVTGLSGHTITVALDEGSDGTLDRIIGGELSLQTVQEIMNRVVEQAKLLGRIDVADGMVIVLPRAEP